MTVTLDHDSFSARNAYMKQRNLSQVKDPAAGSFPNGFRLIGNEFFWDRQKVGELTPDLALNLRMALADYFRR